MTDPLADGEAIAQEILAQLEPMLFIEATEAQHREHCLRLRYRAVMEQQLASAEALPDGLESDSDDERAVHILGMHGGRPVATSRVVLPAPGSPLPTVTAFGLQVPEPDRTVEWGRVVVDPDYRGDGHSIFMGLAAKSWLATRSRGFANVLGATPRRLIALFEALGFVVTVLGEGRHYWGEERYPILCEAKASIRRLGEAWLARPSSRAKPVGDDERAQ